MKTPREAMEEWKVLGLGYPGPDPMVRAAFDVMAPVQILSGGWRSCIYEHAIGPAEVDEVWRLCARIVDAVRSVS